MMTASKPATEFSLCQTKRPERPSTFCKTCSASWSQLEAGNWRTAMFMSFNLETVIFDDGIAEEPVAGVVNLPAPGRLVGAGQLDFQIFADVDGADALVAHLFEGVLDRLALRIQDGLLWCDNNFCFHFTFKRAARGGTARC